MKVIYEVRDKVARITINRPEVMNAMDAEVYAQLSKAWERRARQPGRVDRDHHRRGRERRSPRAPISSR